MRHGLTFRIPLKTTPRSNLNAYFGAGKDKNRFSRRDWNEAELILSNKLENREILPWVTDDGNKHSCEFEVVTPDGYEFTCSCQEITVKIFVLLKI